MRGRSPRTREGRLGPTAQNCSGQWLVVSGQWRRLVWRKLEWELAVTWVPPEVYESSPQYWDAFPVDDLQDTGGIRRQKMPNWADPGIEIFHFAAKCAYAIIRIGRAGKILPAPATFGETVGDSLERVQHIVYRSKG